MLRRTKTQLLNGKPLIVLPERIVEVVPCFFDPSEQEFYNALEGKMESMIEKLMNSQQGNRYIGALVLLLRLRQGLPLFI